MLNNLHVKNLALIDEAEVEFGRGMNVLSGETGAGKSILIGSLSLALGARADSDIIREGAEYALVELSLKPEDGRVSDRIKECGIDCDDDEILIQRRIYPGRSVCRINGETVTLKELSQVSELLYDICGQRDSSTLLKNASLKSILDDCGGTPLRDVKDRIRTLYGEYRDLESKLNEKDDDESLRQRKADLAEFELNEIDAAALVPGEDDTLEADYRRMQHSSRINEAMGAVSELMSSEGASGNISRALKELSSVSEYDEGLSSVLSLLTDIEALSDDLCREIRNYMDEASFDPEEFAQVEERLNLINHLKDKYGRTIELIQKYRDEKEAEIDRLRSYDAYRRELEVKFAELRPLLDAECEKAHQMRKEAAGVLAGKLISELRDLNFLNCELEVRVEADRDKFAADGYDLVDFCISLNPGEPLRPLSSVASGGELSRIMLALKCIMADRDSIGTLIFDEIDTGISGVTAWKTAEKMSGLAGDRQVICITHQAQIAAFADSHFLIEKSTDGSRTTTGIKKLDKSGMENELARMMGADTLSEAALDAARDLKVRAGSEITYGRDRKKI